MVGIMDNDNVSEGLFLKNYLGTVSAVPSPRTVALMDTKPSYAYGEYPKQKNSHALENGILDHARIMYELGGSNENETGAKNQRSNETTRRNSGFEGVIQVQNGDEKEKKKEKKWTLGGFFRRKSKKDADDSSEDSEEDNKKGFLSRRKSKRERRKVKSRTNANGFDVVIPQHKQSTENDEISVEQLWGGDLKPPEATNGPVQRYIHRHPDASKTNNSLQILKNIRKDSNLSRSSVGSENAEGRKGRKEVMARAEAKRDLMRDDSSSDECDSFHSNSSLNRVYGDCRRTRRSDRQKRLSRDEDLLVDLRIPKSDLEGGRRLPHSCRWILRTYYPDSSDHEPVKLNLMNHSGTPSPCRSPRARQKQLFQYMMMQNSYPTSTFPPGVHYQQMRNGTQLSPTRGYFTKENQPLANHRNQSYRTNRNSECSLPKSVSSSENSNRKTLMDYEQFLNSCGSKREKSLSYDQNIHKAFYFENEPEETKNNPQINSIRTNKPEMFTNGGRGANIYNHSPHLAFKTYNGVAENRTDSTPSLQSGIFPHQPTQIIQRSASGNSFCESSRNLNPNLSTSCHLIPANRDQYPRPEVQPSKPLKDGPYSSVTPSLDSMAPKTPSVLRYYADQNPRSRNPIHITCNPTTSEQSYLSDSQIFVKPTQPARNSASDFWKLKDQEFLKQQKKSENLLKPPPTQSTLRSDRSRSNSPRLKETFKTAVQSQGNGFEGFENKYVDSSTKKILKEEYNAAKVNKTPPEPPIRRLSKQEVLARLQKCEQLKNQEKEVRKNLKNEVKSHSSNLDEALNELEVIYNSLRLKDEDLIDRAERRDFPVYRPKNPITPVSVRDKIQNFYAETNYSTPKNPELSIVNWHQRAIPLRRSGVPDKTTDDMAFRKMNQKDRMDVKKLPSQSYLRSSPALSPAQNASPTFRKESPVLEPDITFDDVVFRNIRHANSTLKIQDPQPPFGIPIGLITPAPNSDYLHATPSERFRPTFTSSKTPDVVKDDLAFRNLRKDNKIATSLEPNRSELKKRAVRSLSANLYNIMQKDNPELVPMETNNNIILDKNCEKTQSLTDLTKGKHALEKKLKELKEEKNAKRAEFFELAQEAKKKSYGNISWADLANLNGNFENLTDIKSEKTIFSQEDGSKKFKSPVVELSKYPAAAPSSSLLGNPFKEPSLVDDDHLESLLRALAKEAESASKDLERQLDQLETKKATNTAETSEVGEKRAIEEFDKNLRAVDRTKRRRNLSLSNAIEKKEEIRKTGSLERRKKTDKGALPFEEILRRNANEMKMARRESDAKPVSAAVKAERKISQSDSSSSLGEREGKHNQSFELVTDLSQILHDVEVEQHLNNEISLKDTNNVFQEVYEYNCKFSSPERRKSGGEEQVVEMAKVAPHNPETASDVEKEFEKLHEEVNSTKETDLALVNDLMADITSVDQSPSDSYSSFPFPNEGEEMASDDGALRHRGETSAGSSKGEGIQQRSRFTSHRKSFKGYV